MTSDRFTKLERDLEQLRSEVARLRELASVKPFEPSPFMSRKDVARLLNRSVEEIRCNEARLGLDIARRDLNRRNVRYCTQIVIQQLALRGEIEPTTKTT